MFDRFTTKMMLAAARRGPNKIARFLPPEKGEHQHMVARRLAEAAGYYKSQGVTCVISEEDACLYRAANASGIGMFGGFDQPRTKAEENMFLEHLRTSREKLAARVEELRRK